MNITLRGLLLSLLLVPAVWAAPTTFKVDPAHSSVTFTVRSQPSPVEGRFRTFEGTIDYDQADPKNSKVDFTVQSDSIFTDNEKRDGHLKGADFFDAAKYPTLEFHSKKVLVHGKELSVVGELSMHGVKKPVTVTVTPLGVAKSPNGGTVAGFKAEFVVNRKDYGIIYNKTLDAGGTMLGDDVNVRVLVEAGKK